MVLSMEDIPQTKIIPAGGKASGWRVGWRRRSESNRCIEVLQTSALPLGYAAGPRTLNHAVAENSTGGAGGCQSGARPEPRPSRDGPQRDRPEMERAGPRRRPARMLERETGVEPATSTLARLHSTTELFPLAPGCARRPKILPGDSGECQGERETPLQRASKASRMRRIRAGAPPGSRASPTPN